MWKWRKAVRTPVSGVEPADRPAETDTVHPSRGKVIIMTGASGSGRKATAKRLSQSLGIPYIQPYTTRGIRPQEAEGEHYHFVTDEAFQDMAERGAFFQTVRLERGSYGIAERELMSALGKHHAVIVVVNHEGAEAFRREFGEDAVRIFLYVTKDDIRVRVEREGVPYGVLDEYLANYTDQVSFKKDSEFLLQNLDPDQTVQKIQMFLKDRL